ncbi:hypothetical protein C8Q76DRAFT_702848 [Earliella scabrosa]|nr:hypothetical protein C8Q76DRAFT_702848 [Earliella scabrosa]
MSSSFLDNIELTERIAGDVAHVFPVAGTVFDFSKKRLSKDEIKEIARLKAWEEVAEAGKTMLDEDNREALVYVRAFQHYRSRYQNISEDLTQLMKDLKAVKMYQIRRKRDLYNRSVKSNEDAISLKIEVRNKSALARFELLEKNGKLVVSTLDMHSSKGAAATTSQVTLVGGPSAPIPSGSDDDGCDIADCAPNYADSVHSATSTMRGNPWLKPDAEVDIVMQAVDSDEDETSGVRLDKGKGRA